MSPIVIFLLEQVLPWVLKNLPAILAFLQTNHPMVHAQIVKTVKDQGPGFDWHSGP